MSKSRASIGILGGSFDPIHLGHVHMARCAKAQLQLDSFNVMPCYIAPHKIGVHSSHEHRIAMLELVLGHEPGLELDLREFSREESSYTYLSLCELRSELGS
ncbi:MAG: nicotinate-nucleotide adenylyltransferase, partial [Flavobacteriales bacterium]